MPQTLSTTCTHMSNSTHPELTRPGGAYERGQFDKWFGNPPEPHYWTGFPQESHKVYVMEKTALYIAYMDGYNSSCETE